jgi:hypothetical protein
MTGVAEDALRDMPLESSPLSCAIVEDWLAGGGVSARSVPDYTPALSTKDSFLLSS